MVQLMDQVQRSEQAFQEAGHGEYRLIRRVHCYPIVPQLSRGATPPQPSPGGDEWPPGPRHARAAAATLAAGLDGQRDMDSVCCALEMPCAAAERAVLEAYPDCVFVHR